MVTGGVQQGGEPIRDKNFNIKIFFKEIYVPGIPLLDGGNSAKFLSSAKRTSCSSNVVSLSRSFGVLSNKKQTKF